MRVCHETRNKRWGKLSWSFALAILLAVNGQVQAATSVAPEAQLRRLGLKTATVQTLTLPQTGPPADFSFEIELAGTAFRIPLRPWSVRASDFRLLEQTADGHVSEIAAPAATTYRGEVDGLPGSRVAAAMQPDGLWAWIDTPEQRWLVQPSANDPARAAHVVYRQSDTVATPFSCASVAVPAAVPPSWLPAPDTQPAPPRRAGPTTAEKILAATGISTLEMAIDTDWALYLYHGSSPAAVLADVESIVNAVNLIYETQFQISHTLTAVVMRTTEEDDLGWSWPEFKLDKLREDWLLHHTDIRRDLVHHFCEKDIDGTTVGIAYTGVICENPTATFGLSQTHYSDIWSNRVALTAHEIGHNWGAEHCDADTDCQIMCSGIAGCSPQIDSFGTSAASAIAAHKGAVTCLTAAYSSVVYVDDTVPFPGHGTFSDPYATVGLGAQNSLDGGFLFVRAGQYTETPVISRRLLIKTGQGPAIIGR